MTSVEMKSFIRSDEEPSSLVMKARAHFPNEDAELSTPKERKEIIKEISLSNTSLSLPERESICKDLKRFFPTLVVPDVPKRKGKRVFLDSSIKNYCYLYICSYIFSPYSRFTV